MCILSINPTCPIGSVLNTTTNKCVSISNSLCPNGGVPINNKCNYKL